MLKHAKIWVKSQELPYRVTDGLSSVENSLECKFRKYALTENDFSYLTCFCISSS